MLEKPSTGQQGVNNILSADLKTLVVRTVNRAVNMPEFISQLSNSIIDSPGFATLVAALVKLEQRKTVSDQLKIKGGC